jgi:predicted HTH domain antitoxin
MESIEIKFKLPKSILTVMGKTEKDVEQSIREAIAIDLYRRHQISLGKAAEIAGIGSRWEIIPILAKHDIWLAYTAEDAEQDWEMLREALRR